MNGLLLAASDGLFLVADGLRKVADFVEMVGINAEVQAVTGDGGGENPFEDYELVEWGWIDPTTAAPIRNPMGRIRCDPGGGAEGQAER